MKKEELLGRVNEMHERVTNVLDGLTENEAMRVGLNAQWSVKDLLAHLLRGRNDGRLSSSESRMVHDSRKR